VYPRVVYAHGAQFFASGDFPLTTAKFPPPPKGLAKGGLILWRAIVRTGELRPDSLRVLQDACREADLIDDLEQFLVGEPRTVRGSQGQVVIHPIISELRQHRSVLSTLLRALDLPKVDQSDATDAHDAREAAISLAQARWKTRRAS
jgi:hypothetical protein